MNLGYYFYEDSKAEKRMLLYLRTGHDRIDTHKCRHMAQSMSRIIQFPSWFISGITSDRTGWGGSLRRRPHKDYDKIAQAMWEEFHEIRRYIVFRKDEDLLAQNEPVPDRLSGFYHRRKAWKYRFEVPSYKWLLRNESPSIYLRRSGTDPRYFKLAGETYPDE